MSESEAERLGKARQGAHPKGTPRLYDDPNTEDIIGVAGELAFAKIYGLEVDREMTSGWTSTGTRFPLM